MNNYGFLGVVQQGRFRTLAAERESAAGSFRLTTVGLQASEPPESGELALAAYEGSAIMVRGVDSGDWIYSAVVTEQAGAIVTALVLQVFGTKEGQRPHRLETMWE